MATRELIETLFIFLLAAEIVSRRRKVAKRYLSRHVAAVKAVVYHCNLEDIYEQWRAQKLQHYNRREEAEHENKKSKTL